MESGMDVKERNTRLMRSIMDWGMGILWLCMGAFFIFVKHFSRVLAAQYDDPVMKWFGGVCIVYGIFRMYRGYKKNY
jgi:hypothetical protein